MSVISPLTIEQKAFVKKLVDELWAYEGPDMPLDIREMKGNLYKRRLRRKSEMQGRRFVKNMMDVLEVYWKCLSPKGSESITRKRGDFKRLFPFLLRDEIKHLCSITRRKPFPWKTSYIDEVRFSISKWKITKYQDMRNVPE